jgi:putative glutamine amidotransferase
MTCCIDQLTRPTGRVDQRLRLNMWYADAVLSAGGLPVPLVATSDADLVRQQVDSLDGLLVTGGPDVPPNLYNQAPHPKTSPVCDRRAHHDLAVVHESDNRHMPILGICLGCQVINVARGGTLVQHLDDVDRTPPIHHSDGMDYPPHTVRVKPGSLLHRIVSKEVIEANSSHHQAIDRIGTGLEAVAWAPDGIVEAVEDPSRPFLLAVQWHPEVIAHLPDHHALFLALVQVARNR